MGSSSNKIFIARHGERLDFVDPTWYSKAEKPHDPPLTSRGKHQATDLGRALRPYAIKHVYASPFTRCINTAVNAAAAIDPSMHVNVEPGACEWLNEFWYDDTENGPLWRDVHDLKREFVNIDATYENIFPISHNIDGYPETKDDCMNRCLNMVRGILDNVREEGNILIVGHGTSVDALCKGLVPGIPHKPVSYCCLTECIPTPVAMKYEVGMHCETSFLTHAEDAENTRYI